MTRRPQLKPRRWTWMDGDDPTPGVALWGRKGLTAHMTYPEARRLADTLHDLCDANGNTSHPYPPPKQNRNSPMNDRRPIREILASHWEDALRAPATLDLHATPDDDYTPPLALNSPELKQRILQAIAETGTTTEQSGL